MGRLSFLFDKNTKFRRKSRFIGFGFSLSAAFCRGEEGGSVVFAINNDIKRAAHSHGFVRGNTPRGGKGYGHVRAAYLYIKDKGVGAVDIYRSGSIYGIADVNCAKSLCYRGVVGHFEGDRVFRLAFFEGDNVSTVDHFIVGDGITLAIGYGH